MDFKLVTIIGSNRFQEEILKEQQRITLMGYIVLAPCVFTPQNDATVEMLNLMIRKDIIMSDIVYVVNKDHYIGPSTLREVDFAYKQGKIVTYMEYDNDLSLRLTEETV